MYGVHLRGFDLDERGRIVSRQRSHLAPHSRETRLREAQAIISRSSNSMLPLDGSRSQDEEFKKMTDRSRERDDWQAGLISADRSGTGAAVTDGLVAARFEY